MHSSIQPNPAPSSDAHDASLPPADLLILGAGKFGRIAATRIHQRYPQAALLVVDESAEKLGQLTASQAIPTRAMDALTFLAETQIDPERWIIPAVPVHVAYWWVQATLARTASVRRLPVPAVVDAQVPNPLRVPSGTVYASYATFRCPDSCSEPAELCTHTKQPRLGNLFSDLAAVTAPGFSTHVLRSVQLCPGVGGYTGIRLQRLLDEVGQNPGRHLIATSCRCHGVLDALEWNPA